MSKSVLERYKGLSFADAAQKVSDKYKDRFTDSLKQKAFEEEMQLLFKKQQLDTMKKQLAEKKQNKQNSPSSVTNSEVPQMEQQEFALGGFVNPSGSGGLVPDDILQTLNAVPPANHNMLASLNAEQGIQDRVAERLEKKAQAGNLIERLPQKQPELGNQNTDVKGMLNDIYQGVELGSDFNWDLDSVLSDTSTGSSTKSKKSFSDRLKDMNAYAPALAGAGVNMFANLAMLSGGYDKVSPALNPYEDEIKTKVDSMSINKDAIRDKIMSSYGRARDNTSNLRSEATRQAVLQGANTDIAGKLAETELVTQQGMNQILGQQANIYNTLGMQKANAEFQAAELEARNKGTYQTAVSQAAAQAGNIGKFFTMSKLNKAQNDVMLKILNEKGLDFKLNEDLTRQLQSGVIDTEQALVQLVNSGQLTKAQADEIRLESYKQRELRLKKEKKETEKKTEKKTEEVDPSM